MNQPDENRVQLYKTANIMSSNIILTLILTIQIKISVGDPLVLLPDGWIRGREATTLQNKTFYAFEKVPYAAPPVGNLRFKAPRPPQKWNVVLDTTVMNVICFQTSTNLPIETEDCLYLNVFTPQLPNNEGNGLLPVMLYIYGGGFTDGTNILYGPDHFINEDVILVTINYRVGIFGFLSTQDEVIPGNNGLKDQHLAIKWVHDNIKLFGGDPEKITIFGQSAGSASCTYQLLNQKSEGLFRGAILQSGSFLSPWAYQRRAREIAFTTASYLNPIFKFINDSSILLRFLQSLDARDVDFAAQKYHKKEYGPRDLEISQGFYWAPVVEVENPDAFLTQKMYELLENGNVVKVPTLIGMNSEESLAFNSDPRAVKINMESYDAHLDWLVPNDMQLADDRRTLMGWLIRYIYTGGEPFSENLGAGVRYSSDTSFTRPIMKHAELYSKLADTYFYQFSYDGKMGHGDIHYDGAESVGHGEEYFYLFCPSRICNIDHYPLQDHIVQKRLIKIWTNFAKYLNPTPERSEILQNITWPLLSTDEGNFFYVDIGENLQIKNHPKEDTYNKWILLYSSLGRSNFDTY